MERFMTKGGGLMSKDHFRRPAAAAKPEEKKPLAAPSTSTTATTTTSDAPPQPAAASSSLEVGAARRPTLGAGSQIMSKNHFRTLRPPKSKGLDGQEVTEPTPTRMPSPPTLRRAETWTSSADEKTFLSRGDPSAPAPLDPASDEAAGIWASCPALTLIEKRRKEEEKLDQQQQEVISLWREIEGEALDALVLEVPSEEDDESRDERVGKSPRVGAAAAHEHQHQHDEHQHHQQQGEEKQAAKARPNGAQAGATERVARMPSTMGDEEQDISDVMSESTGALSEREDSGAERHSVHPSSSKANKVKGLVGGEGTSKSANGIPIRRGASAMPSGRLRKEHKDKKLKRASVLGVGKEGKRESDDNDVEDDDDDDDDDDDEEEESDEEDGGGAVGAASSSSSSSSSNGKAVERPRKKPGLYVGRIYSSLRRKKNLTHDRVDSDSESDDDKIERNKSGDKKRGKEDKKRKHKDKAEKKREAKKDAGAVAANAEHEHGHEHAGGEEAAAADGSKKSPHQTPTLRGTMPKNFKMHFMEKLKSGDPDDSERNGKDKKDKKIKRKKRKPKDVHRQASVSDARRGSGALSYSEPEPDLGKDRIVAAGPAIVESSDSEGGGELKKQLKQAQKKNKEQEEKIRKQQSELERMRKELERVRRERKERKRKERESGSGDKDKEKKGKKTSTTDLKAGEPDDKRKSAAFTNKDSGDPGEDSSAGAKHSEKQAAKAGAATKKKT